MEQDANASLTAAPTGTLSSVCSSDLQTGSNQRPDQTAPHVVAPTSQPQGRHGLSSLTDVRDFFMHLFNLGLTVATSRGHRSAIAAIHEGFQDGSSISNNTG
jgi:hypothetical protein